jgi:hypothetical protein
MDLVGMAGGEKVTLMFDPQGLLFQTLGTAVSVDPAPKTGALATQTGVFDGMVQFRGNPSALSIVAMPGTFAMDFR